MRGRYYQAVHLAVRNFFDRPAWLVVTAGAVVGVPIGLGIVAVVKWLT